MPRKDTQFRPGNPGRPKGSKNKITQKYLDRLWEHFKEHGNDVLDRVCRDRPDVYLKLVASLIPRDFDVKHGGDVQIQVVSFADVTQDDLKVRQETFESDATPLRKLDS